MNLYEAIFVRKSVRKYKMAPLEDSLMEDILLFANSIPMLFEENHVLFEIVDALNEPIKLKGNFVVDAPYYMNLYASRGQGYLLNAGYVTEQISLYMTTKGIGSCYLGMVKRKEKTIQEDDTSYDYVLTLAFGEGEAEVYRNVEKTKRLPLEDVAIYKENVKKNMKALVNAGRMAPSSMNNQPWKFVVYNSRIHLFCKKNSFLTRVLKDLKQIDMGVCIAHLLVAAEELWIDCKMVYMENISNKNFQKYEYVVSLKILLEKEL